MKKRKEKEIAIVDILLLFLPVFFLCIFKYILIYLSFYYQSVVNNHRRLIYAAYLVEEKLEDPRG